jgi:thioredoxin reductase
VIGISPGAIYHASLLAEWGPVTVLLDGAFAPDPDARADLARRGIAVEDAPVLGIEGEADIRLADGRTLSFAGVYIATRTRPSSDLPQDLGCEMEEMPQGVQIRTHALKATTVPGVHACGDAARAMHSVSLAVGDGALAGVATHRSLVFPE